MNQTFPKYPKALGRLSTDFNIKWRSLFHDWENSVIGSTNTLSNKQIWNKIAIYISNSKRKEKFKSEEFLQENMLMSDRRDTNDKFDRSSLKSNASVYSQYSLRSNRELHTKLQNFNQKIDHIKDKTVSLQNDKMLSQSETCSNKEVLYDNLKNGSHLLDMFKFRKDATESLLNKFSGDHENGLDIRRKSSSGVTLDYVPSFGITQLEQQDLISIKDYLMEAFRDQHHPLGVLNSKISFCFYTSYGCWKVKPTSILSSQAMKEWEMISKRIYFLIRKLFPALPVESDVCDGEIISHQSLLYPILLSEGIYSTLFVLYASKCSQSDETYRQRTYTCDKKSNKDLISFLRIESNLLPMIRSNQFENAILCLKQVKEQYCPRKMLNQIENTFKLMDEAKCEVLGKSYILNADNIMPLTIFLIIRAGIPHLGAELLLLEDLMGSDFEPVMLGFAGYCFATVKATYQHILSDKFFQD
ncbi:Alsin like [Pseudolycoriella hygida]|uniref:Alsin like n=1 Tax=Pseudolycoriella hygida TaxID=35572 RepID=A0A9Q0S570_9DIPT|nr:Alsin like [Pseudolycoriella hygida]